MDVQSYVTLGIGITSYIRPDFEESFAVVLLLYGNEMSHDMMGKSRFGVEPLRGNGNTEHSVLQDKGVEGGSPFMTRGLYDSVQQHFTPYPPSKSHE